MSLRRNNVTAAAAAALAARAPKAAILDGAGAGLPPVDLSDGPGPDSCPDERSGALLPVRVSRHLLSDSRERRVLPTSASVSTDTPDCIQLADRDHEVCCIRDPRCGDDYVIALYSVTHGRCFVGGLK